MYSHMIGARGADGYMEAAAKLAYLIGAIRGRQISGVTLKDEQNSLLSG